MEVTDERNPALQEAYRNENKDELPLCESLKDTIARAVPYYEEEILPKMKEGKRIIIAAHGNSLRALVKYFENLSDEEIIDVNIPTGIPLVYTFDDEGKFISKEYLGDQSAIEAKMQAVANQGAKKQ